MASESLAVISGVASLKPLDTLEAAIQALEAELESVEKHIEAEDVDLDELDTDVRNVRNCLRLVATFIGRTNDLSISLKERIHSVSFVSSLAVCVNASSAWLQGDASTDGISFSPALPACAD